MEELKLLELIECHQAWLQVNKEILDLEPEKQLQLLINLELVETFKQPHLLINLEAHTKLVDLEAALIKQVEI